MEIYKIDEDVNRLSKIVLDQAFYVHSKLGPGLLESVYEQCLAVVLTRQGLKVEKQKILPVIFEDIRIETGFRIDLMVEDKLIIELKAHEKILPVHEAQLHTYLKLSHITLGLIINFNERSLRNGIKRIALAQNKDANFV
jgi:GxxExxY protein